MKPHHILNLFKNFYALIVAKESIVLSNLRHRKHKNKISLPGEPSFLSISLCLYCNDDIEHKFHKILGFRDSLIGPNFEKLTEVPMIWVPRR